MVKKQKSYSKSKNVKKITKKLKICSFKIHKGAGIFKSPQNIFHRNTGLKINIPKCCLKRSERLGNFQVALVTKNYM